MLGTLAPPIATGNLANQARTSQASRERDCCRREAGGSSPYQGHQCESSSSKGSNEQVEGHLELEEKDQQMTPLLRAEHLLLRVCFPAHIRWTSRGSLALPAPPTAQMKPPSPQRSSPAPSSPPGARPLPFLLYRCMQAWRVMARRLPQRSCRWRGGSGHTLFRERHSRAGRLWEARDPLSAQKEHRPSSFYWRSLMRGRRGGVGALVGSKRLPATPPAG